MLYPILISLVIGCAAAWLVKNWKDGAEIALYSSQQNDVEARNAILVGANRRCETNIEAVRSGIQTIADAEGKREGATSAPRSAMRCYRA
jgi:hypothetical protein